MPAVVSSRLLFLVGESIPFGRLLRVSRTACFHRDMRFFSRVRRHTGPLTLGSLGFRSEVDEVKKTIVSKGSQRDSRVEIAVEQLNPPTENEPEQLNFQFEEAKIKPEMGKVKEARKSLKIEAAPFAAESFPELGQFEEAKIKPKMMKVKEARKSLKIEAAPFAAESFPELGQFEEAIKPKMVKVKEARKSLKIEAAPFAAESFTELGLPPLLLKRLEQEGFTKPTDVQSSAVPTILKGNDAVIQSYTGSGKTLAYVLPILSEVGPLKRESAGVEDSGRRNEVEAVIVAPSRELGMQIVREFEKLLGPDKRMVQQLVGGANKTRQEEALKKNKPVIVVGTPGRISEISASGKLHTHGCRFLVLDEVDELLAFNFREDMHRILQHVGRKSGAGSSSVRRTIMVSATVPFSVVRAAQSWCRDPLLVRAKIVGPLESVPTPTRVNLPGSNPNPSSPSEAQAPSQAASESMPPLLKHYYCTANLQHKVDTLRRCVHALDAKCVIAFMNQNRQLKDTVHKLEARGMTAAELHGDLNKLARSTVLKKFRSGEIRVLVTNELAARGLDVTECDLVVNLGLPTDAIHYAHRAGRTGRLGRKGVVVTVCEDREVFVAKKLQKQLGIDIQACDFLEGKLVIKKEEDA